LVRPLGDAFQIVAGHHRKAAAGLAGLVTVPCWVREMDDEEAFMALVLANSQSELLPLERGMHALRATELDKHGRQHQSLRRSREPARTDRQPGAPGRAGRELLHGRELGEGGALHPPAASPSCTWRPPGSGRR
jgi:ParB-like chromosome segregation protein Spo0J